MDHSLSCSSHNGSFGWWWLFCFLFFCFVETELHPAQLELLDTRPSGGGMTHPEAHLTPWWWDNTPRDTLDTQVV